SLVNICGEGGDLSAGGAAESPPAPQRGEEREADGGREKDRAARGVCEVKRWGAAEEVLGVASRKNGAEDAGGAADEEVRAERDPSASAALQERRAQREPPRVRARGEGGDPRALEGVMEERRRARGVSQHDAAR